MKCGRPDDDLYTYAEIARELGVSEKTVRRIEVTAAANFIDRLRAVEEHAEQELNRFRAEMTKKSSSEKAGIFGRRAGFSRGSRIVKRMLTATADLLSDLADLRNRYRIDEPDVAALKAAAHKDRPAFLAEVDRVKRTAPAVADRSETPDAFEAHQDNPELARMMRILKLSAENVRQYGPRGGFAVNADLGEVIASTKARGA